MYTCEYVIVLYVRGQFLKLRIFPFNIYNPNLLYSSYPFVLDDISSYIVCSLSIYMSNICWISGIISGLVYPDKETFEVC